MVQETSNCSKITSAFHSPLGECFTLPSGGREASPSEFSRGGGFAKKLLFFVTPLPEGSSLAFDPPGGRVKAGYCPGGA